MEFWLSFNNFQEKLQLPVNPGEYRLSTSKKNKIVEILDLGDINLIGGEGLAEIQITSIFPREYLPYCSYMNIPAPYMAIELIEKWKQSGKPIRLIITDTTINMAVSIETFEYGETGGNRDVTYTLTLKEYRFVKVTQVNNIEESSPRQITQESPVFYVVKTGDTLYIISKRLTGTGDNWRQIYDANKAIIGADPKIIIPGQKLVIPA